MRLHAKAIAIATASIIGIIAIAVMAAGCMADEPLPARVDYTGVVPMPGSYSVGITPMPETRPTVPEEWISSPEHFDSEEGEADYESNWHSNRSLRSKYGLTYVTTDTGKCYVAGELLVVFFPETTTEEMEALAAEAGAVVCEVNQELMEPCIVAVFVFPDDTDVVAYIDALSDREGVQSVSTNSVGTVDGGGTSDVAETALVKEAIEDEE